MTQPTPGAGSGKLLRPYRSNGERVLTGVLWSMTAGLVVLVIVLLLRDDSSSEVADAATTTAIALSTTSTPTGTSVAPSTTTTLPASTTTEPTQTTSTGPPTTTTELVTTTTELLTTTTETPTTTTEVPTTTAPPGPANVVAGGSITVSSEHPSGRFPIALAFDTLRETSWVSAGDADLACVGLSCRRLSWSSISWLSPGVSPFLISEIRILNSSANPEAEFRSGFGSVIISLYNDDPLNAIYSQEFDLSGTGPDPDLIIQPNLVADSVAISFVGHDNPTSGGISELEIIALPA